MEITEALLALGAKRVIWIDDDFNEEDDLAEMLMRSIDIAAKCTTPGFVDCVERYRISDDPGEIKQFVLDLSPDARASLKSEFFSHETEDKQLPTKELEDKSVEAACKLLGVADTDRLTFKAAHEMLEELCKAGDDSFAYIIDLNESGGSPTEGLAVLENLRAFGSKATAFILTHEATAQTEGEKEQALRDQLVAGDAGRDNLVVPVCVVSKERLAGDDAEMGEALKIAIKRAGLRRSVHEVLNGASDIVDSGFRDAAEMLLQIPPEQLDHFVVERGFNEGVSELHVLERAITAKIGERLRHLFATDGTVANAAARVRSLRAVQLKATGLEIHKNLADFRRIEVWESAELLNTAHTAIACGDVFESCAEDLAQGQAMRRFLLLGQPCDIALRPAGKRDQSAAYFIPLKLKAADAEEKVKEALLQFQLDGQQWTCDFRAGTMVNLAVLDLASLRSDGAVRVEAGQVIPDSLLPGLKKVAGRRLEPAAKWNEMADCPAGIIKDCNLQLSMRSDDVYKSVHLPKLFLAAAQGRNAGPRRVTWGLRRIGRVRSPFASALFRDYLSVAGREAFDVDFASATAAEAIGQL